MSGGIQTCLTLIGMVSISDDGLGNIDGIYLPNSNLPFKEQRTCSVLTEAMRQIDEYFAGKRMTFRLSLKTKGTEFQEAVWNEIGKIPYGETATYSDIAKKVGSPKAYRAVGNACNANPIPLIIPCHRIVASSGIGGYGGGLALKKKLMELEKIQF